MLTRNKVLIAALMASTVSLTAIPTFAATPAADQAPVAAVQADDNTDVKVADYRDNERGQRWRNDRGPRHENDGPRDGRHGGGRQAENDRHGPPPGGPHGFGGPGGPRGFGGPGPAAMTVMVERFDANDDGVISKDEIASVSAERLKAFDKNADGKLSLDEFTALWTDTMKLQIVRAFQQRDPDGDAMVTLDEYSAPFDKMLARLDRNDDGKIDATEMHGPRGPGGPGGPGGPQGGPPGHGPMQGDGPGPGPGDEPDGDAN